MDNGASPPEVGGELHSGGEAARHAAYEQQTQVILSQLFEFSALVRSAKHSVCALASAPPQMAQDGSVAQPQGAAAAALEAAAALQGLDAAEFDPLVLLTRPLASLATLLGPARDSRDVLPSGQPLARDAMADVVDAWARCDMGAVVDPRSRQWCCTKSLRWWGVREGAATEAEHRQRELAEVEAFNAAQDARRAEEARARAQAEAAAAAEREWLARREEELAHRRASLGAPSHHSGRVPLPHPAQRHSAHSAHGSGGAPHPYPAHFSSHALPRAPPHAPPLAGGHAPMPAQVRGGSEYHRQAPHAPPLRTPGAVGGEGWQGAGGGPSALHRPLPPPARGGPSAASSHSAAGSGYPSSSGDYRREGEEAGRSSRAWEDRGHRGGGGEYDRAVGRGRGGEWEGGTDTSSRLGGRERERGRDWERDRGDRRGGGERSDSERERAPRERDRGADHRDYRGSRDDFTRR